MLMINHDVFLPAIVMMSHTPCCSNISGQYNGTHVLLTVMTPHNMATSATRLLAHQFLCPAIVSALEQIGGRTRSDTWDHQETLMLAGLWLHDKYGLEYQVVVYNA